MTDSIPAGLPTFLFDVSRDKNAKAYLHQLLGIQQTVTF